MTDLKKTEVVTALRAVLLGPDMTAALAVVIASIVEGDYDVPVPDRAQVGESSRGTQTRVRFNDPDTSFDSALLDTSEKQRWKFEAIYNTLMKHGPCTDDELRAHLAEDGYVIVKESVTKRRGDLKVKRWVRDTGLRRPGNTTRPMIVWEALD